MFVTLFDINHLPLFVRLTLVNPAQAELTTGQTGFTGTTLRG